MGIPADHSSRLNEVIKAKRLHLTDAEDGSYPVPDQQGHSTSARPIGEPWPHAVGERRWRRTDGSQSSIIHYQIITLSMLQNWRWRSGVKCGRITGDGLLFGITEYGGERLRPDRGWISCMPRTPVGLVNHPVPNSTWQLPVCHGGVNNAARPSRLRLRV
jgi:hypothetical protein